MRFVLLVVVAVLMASTAHAQTPATPAGTSTPAATASADGSQRRDEMSPAVGGFAYEKPVTAEGGFQIGKTADGATLFTFAKRVKCTVNPIAVSGPGATTRIRCAATGAATGDYVSCTLPLGSASGVVLKSAATGTDYVEMSLVGIHDVFVDVGAVDIECLVLR